MNDNLPPLPPCDVFGYGSRDTPDYEALGYTAEQMREYGKLCRQQALEEAEQYFKENWMAYHTKEEIADAIRSLK